MQENPDINKRQVFTLSQITDSIARMFDKFYQNPYWIKAEISALNLYPVSGHCFPLMVEKSDGKVKAQLKAIIWKEDLFEISRKFEATTNEPLTEGMSIMFLAYIKFTSSYGLTLQIIDIEPLYTLGEMARDKLNSIKRLKSEGVFEMNKSLAIPVLCQRVAIISVASSKGYSDLIITLQTNIQRFKVHTELFPAVLQGKDAVNTITRQLNYIKEIHHQFDIVVIVRGGGDDVGLSCYDDVNLAREVALFPIPVVTGIGHSTNETVVEMVACINKITPTDVAHFILAGFRDQEMKLNELQQTMTASTIVFVNRLKENLGSSILRFNNSTLNFLTVNRTYLASLTEIIVTTSSRLISINRIVINGYEMSIRQSPRQILYHQNMAILNHSAMLTFKCRHFLTLHKNELEVIGNKLTILNPESVLKRGYCIIRKDGKSSDGTDIEQGDNIKIETYNRHISGTITEISTK